MLSGVSLLAVSNVNNPVGLVCLPYVMWSAHFFVTHTQTEKIRSWNGPTVHVCCFMLARASNKTFVSRVRKTAKKIFFSRKIRQQGHSLAEVSLYIMYAYQFYVLAKRRLSLHPADAQVTFLGDKIQIWTRPVPFTSFCIHYQAQCLSSCIQRPFGS